MDELELERTFLAKELPKEIEGADFVEIVDIYIPDGPEHSHLRLRKKGNKRSITKKTPMADDASEMMEYTIELDEAEYEALASCSKKRVAKKRYFAKIDGFDAEVDVFLEDLAGLVLVDFEFDDVDEKNKFKTPKSMLADVTPEEFIAGGMLAGKRYEDIEGELEKYGYKKIGNGEHNKMQNNEYDQIEKYINDTGIDDETRRLISDFAILWNRYENELYGDRRDGLKIIKKKIKSYNYNIYSDRISNYFREMCEYIKRRIPLNGDNAHKYFHFRSEADPNELNRLIESKDNKDELYFLLLIVTRVRNNMFHGLKELKGINKRKRLFEICNMVLKMVLEMEDRQKILNTCNIDNIEINNK